MSLGIYPIPANTISGTVKTEDVESRDSLERLINQMGVLLQQQAFITGINLEEE